MSRPPQEQIELEVTYDPQGHLTVIAPMPDGVRVILGRLIYGSFQPSTHAPHVAFGSQLLRDLADLVDGHRKDQP